MQRSRVQGRKHNLPNGIPHVFQRLVVIGKLFADFTKEEDHAGSGG
jgi:hypothetical protein